MSVAVVDNKDNNKADFKQESHEVVIMEPFMLSSFMLINDDAKTLHVSLNFIDIFICDFPLIRGHHKQTFKNEHKQQNDGDDFTISFSFFQSSWSETFGGYKLIACHEVKDSGQP